MIWGVYTLIGVFGSLGLIARKSDNPENPLIYSFFPPGDVIPFLVASIFYVFCTFSHGLAIFLFCFKDLVFLYSVLE